MPAWRNTGAVLSAAAGAAALGAAGMHRVLRASVPPTAGTLQAPGLRAPVTIDRDAWGIPHLAASYVEDLFFANGFVHAQDRFWQMEMTRRIGSGRLSELFGTSTLPVDRLMRRIGLRRVAEEEASGLEGVEQDWLAAYCRGVNHYLSTASHRLPLELLLVRALPPPLWRWHPEPYTVADVFTLTKVLAFGLSANLGNELIRMAVLERLGPERAAALEPDEDRTDGAMPVPGAESRPALDRLAHAYQELAPFLALTGAGGASNSWVVDGTRTASGKPLLANDPHLQLQIPSFWYELELNGPGFDVVGASLAGAPGVVIGHNRRIAWGVTNSFLDVQDLVIEQPHPRHPHLYRFRDQWREGRIVREEIRVRGRREPVVEEVLITHHGPVISPALPDEARSLALRWTALEAGTLPRALLAINRAANWTEFTDALRFWDVPSQTFLYADVSGNIGSYTPGKVPLRARGIGALPVPGWTGEHEWIGYIPFDQLPHTYNPESHRIVAANTRPVDGDYPYYLGADWLPAFRAQRISDLLSQRPGLTVDDCRSMLADCYSIPGMQAAAILRDTNASTPAERAIQDQAAAWDGILSAETIGGCICMVFQHALLRTVLHPILGDLTETYLGTGTLAFVPTNGFYSRAVPFLYDLVRAADDQWFAGMGVPEQTWSHAKHQALVQTVQTLQERLGPDPGDWQWGRLNQLRFPHALGIRPPLARLFNRGPLPLGGDDNTVAAAKCPLYNPYHTGGWASSYRQIVDLGSLGNSLSMHTTGQSGHVTSPHYDDMIEAWQRFRYHSMSLAVGDTRRELGGHLVLEPAAEHEDTSTPSSY